jgi:hypothetical protein
VPAEIDLSFVIEEPKSPAEVGWSADELPLGILLRAVALQKVDRFVRAGERIVFTEGSSAERFLGEGVVVA